MHFITDAFHASGRHACCSCNLIVVRPVASLAVLADEHQQWRSTSFGFETLGCSHTIKFPVAKLTDYEDKLDELLASDNAFGWITAAHILTRQTRKQHQERYAANIDITQAP
ncbi:MAG: hypothetical protein WCI01_06515 [Chlorobiaceae bacterium]